MRKGKLVRHIPNSLTIANMILGFSAIILIIQTDLPRKEFIVLGLVMLGGIADLLDGRIARKFGVCSDIGKQLDSFADIITFGVAPVSLLNYLCRHSILTIIISSIFIIAGAYRLARHNLNPRSKHLMGLPISIAAAILLVYCIKLPQWAVNQHPAVCMAATSLILILLSAMMLSKREIKKIPIIMPVVRICRKIFYQK